jgi:ABC-2 type transport system ATP-binding protein
LYGLRGTDLDGRIDRLLTRVDLLDAADRPLRGYSKGMLQRAGLAQALLNDPQLVFLDEPTSGLDPLGRLLVRSIIDELRSDGVAVFLNSHLLGEVEATCDRVAFVKRGRVVGDLSLREGAPLLDLELRVTPVDASLRAGLGEFGSVVRFQEDGAIVMRISNESRVPVIVEWLVARHIEVHAVHPRRQSLEVLFVAVTSPNRVGGGSVCRRISGALRVRALLRASRHARRPALVVPDAADDAGPADCRGLFRRELPLGGLCAPVAN